MTLSGLAAYTPVELARLRLLSRATGCPLEQMLGCPWNTADLEPEALLQMVDEMERVAALLLALVGNEQDADVVRQLHHLPAARRDLPRRRPAGAPGPPHARTRERKRPAPAGVTKLRHVHSQLDVIAAMLGRQFPAVETMLRDATHGLV
jgi:hypothetical protein